MQFHGTGVFERAGTIIRGRKASRPQALFAEGGFARYGRHLADISLTVLFVKPVNEPVTETSDTRLAAFRKAGWRVTEWAYFTRIVTLFGVPGAAFGSSMRSTPFLYDALALSASTGELSGTTRRKLP